MPDLPIDLSRPRYDQSTFVGRLKHFLGIIDFRTLWKSDKEIEEAQKLLADYQNTGVIPDDNPDKLWEAKRVVDSIIHPDTGKKIPAAFRISGFVPANILICMGMLLPGAGLANQIFWQWVNQSYNVALNYSNRNASSEMSTSTITINYLAAVSTSCGVAFGLTKFSQSIKKPMFPAAKQIISLGIPFFAVVTAGILNVFLMRRNEITEGINLTTRDGEVVGKSKIAGWKALSMVSGVRVVTSIPVLTAVPITYAMLERKFLVTRPRWKIPVNLALIIAALYVGLPCAVALFPQMVPIEVDKVEDEFKNIKDKNGEQIQTLYFNRGL